MEQLQELRVVNLGGHVNLAGHESLRSQAAPLGLHRGHHLRVLVVTVAIGLLQDQGLVDQLVEGGLALGPRRRRASPRRASTWRC